MVGIFIVAIIVYVVILIVLIKRRIKKREEKTYEKSQGKDFVQTTESGVLYAVKGVRGRFLRVYEDRCVINVKAGVGSFLTGNATDGEKTIYYADCVGVQYKDAGFAIGYLQLETSSSSGNNRSDNFFNENSFTFDLSTISNEKMQIVAEFVKGKVAECKRASRGGTVVAALSPADELKKYKELLDAGIITQAEFDAKKQVLLGL